MLVFMKKEKELYRNRIQSLSILKIIVLFGGLIFYAPVALLVRTRFGITYSQFFLLQAILSFSIFLFEIPCGFITDRIGYKKTLLFSNFFILIARILMFCANNFILFCLEVVLEGISFAFNSGTISSYLYCISEKKFAKNSAVIGNYSNAGFLISTIGFSIINSLWGMNGLLLSTIFCSLIAFLFSFQLENIHVNATKVTSDRPKIKGFRKYPFGMTDTMIILLTGFINISFLLINFFYISMILELNLNENYMTILILAYTGIQFISPYIIEKIGEYNAFYKMEIALAITIVIVFGIALLSNFFVFIPMLLLPTALSILSVYLNKYQNAHIDGLGLHKDRATVLSFYSMFSNFIEIVFLFGSAKMSHWSVHTVFIALAIGLLLLLLFLCVMEKRVKSKLV